MTNAHSAMGLSDLSVRESEEAFRQAMEAKYVNTLVGDYMESDKVYSLDSL
jgi:hypothetical protein